MRSKQEGPRFILTWNSYLHMAVLAVFSVDGGGFSTRLSKS